MRARDVLLNFSVSPFTSLCVAFMLVCGSVCSVSKADLLLISAVLNIFSNGSSGNRRGPEVWSGLAHRHLHFSGRFQPRQGICRCLLSSSYHSLLLTGKLSFLTTVHPSSVSGTVTFISSDVGEGGSVKATICGGRSSDCPCHFRDLP